MLRRFDPFDKVTSMVGDIDGDVRLVIDTTALQIAAAYSGRFSFH